MSAYVPASEYQGGSMNDGIRSSTKALEMTMNHRCGVATRQIEGACDCAAARVAENRPCTDVAIRRLSVHSAGLLERQRLSSPRRSTRTYPRPESPETNSLVSADSS